MLMFPGTASENHKKFWQNSWSPDKDSNHGPPNTKQELCHYTATLGM